MRRKNKTIIIILILFTIIITLTAVAYAMLKQNLKLTGTVTLENKAEDSGEQAPPSENPEKPEVGEKKADVICNFEYSWQSGNKNYFQYTVIIKNIGEVEISSWQFDISIKGNTKIEHLWNANYFQNGKVITFLNTSYNGNIDVNRDTSFGIIINTNLNVLELNATNIIVN